MANVLYYYNRQDFPISFSYNGTRVTLWNKNDIVKDAEGNPIVDPILSKPEYVTLGLSPRLPSDTPLVIAKTPRPSAPTPTPTPIPLEEGEKIVASSGSTLNTNKDKDDAASITVNPKAPITLATHVLATSEKKLVGVIQTHEKAAFIPKDQLSEVDMGDATRLVVRQEGGMWVFKLNNYENLSPAGMKAHIRATFGKELLERVKFET